MVGLSLQYPGFHQQAISHLHRLLLCTPPPPPKTSSLANARLTTPPAQKKSTSSLTLHAFISSFHFSIVPVTKFSEHPLCRHVFYFSLPSVVSLTEMYNELVVRI
ncbi:hypothetical protein Pst134EA_009155 [Puccinia striiformis f. sp. tritici]|uniref:hypothetical protein n=1 Tax=Puccinia striiformis f. sp. tritici TaxID=168172 RepID=UPI002008A227|nr:hypothetical protein Pst134EA_009155 [Puccinia striiformis f. sp. tritici]KAH9468620.1 hypothetical protein Pst134EA_009155 [Puccinia striiformis f. sp. tritici]